MGILVLKVLGKTAIKLIQSYGSVENVLTISNHLHWSTEKIATDKENLILSKTISGNLYGCAYRYNCII